IVAEWPRAQEFGFPDETAAFGLQYGHGVGLSIWEKPIFSRLVSLEHEEELVVTATGCEVVTKFPAEELLVAGQRYFSVGGALPLVREAQSHLNTAAGRGEAG